MSTTKESKVEIDDETKSKLVDLAVKQMSLAYCPYSKYQAGHLFSSVSAEQSTFSHVQVSF